MNRIRPTLACRGHCLKALLALWLLAMWPLGMSQAGPVYRYQKDGVWHFTDTPPADAPGEIRNITPEGPAPAPPGAGNPLLAIDYPTRNPIEQATAATVAVKSTLGAGSGFFVTHEGHILTNKHVVRTTESQAAKTEAQFQAAEKQIDHLEQRFDEEQQRLRTARQRLEAQQSAAKAEPHPQRRNAYQQDYEANRGNYQSWHADFQRRRDIFENEKRRFRDSRQDYRYSASLADLAQRFTITLADGTTQYARLLAVSASHDLALLKLDGYQTPALRPAPYRRTAQGDPVYAIGNPANLQNSVTSGILSGVQQGFLQTNAQIYPGNSGGPLVTAEGQVLGINTFKALTHKFEGLGFAIPIETALEAFSDHLPKH
ncbi:MAG: trypsin-like peptidase domain-containing protein [Desulfatitalea sp.]|nr:trypsin-like peptidase domain-containing protein [Desulfatitalea sp.]